MGKIIGNVTYQADDLADLNQALAEIASDANLVEISRDEEGLKVVFNINS